MIATFSHMKAYKNTLIALFLASAVIHQILVSHP